MVWIVIEARCRARTTRHATTTHDMQQQNTHTALKNTHARAHTHTTDLRRRPKLPAQYLPFRTAVCMGKTLSSVRVCTFADRSCTPPTPPHVSPPSRFVPHRLPVSSQPSSRPTRVEGVCSERRPEHVGVRECASACMWNERWNRGGVRQGPLLQGGLTSFAAFLAFASACLLSLNSFLLRTWRGEALEIRTGT